MVAPEDFGTVVFGRSTVDGAFIFPSSLTGTLAGTSKAALFPGLRVVQEGRAPRTITRAETLHMHRENDGVASVGARAGLPVIGATEDPASGENILVTVVAGADADDLVANAVGQRFISTGSRLGGYVTSAARSDPLLLARIDIEARV